MSNQNELTSLTVKRNGARNVEQTVVKPFRFLYEDSRFIPRIDRSQIEIIVKIFGIAFYCDKDLRLIKVVDNIKAARTLSRKLKKHNKLKPGLPIPQFITFWRLAKDLEPKFVWELNYQLFAETENDGGNNE